MEIEMKMEAVEVLPLAGDDVAPVLGEDFSVDDLLNFGGDEEGDDQTARHNEREKAKEIGGENSNSSFSSAVSFEATPVPELTAVEVAELEWVSRIMDESESQTEIPKMYTFALKSNHSQQQLQQQSPVQPPQVPVKAKRSKRTRSLSICWSSCSGGTPLPTSPSSSQSTTTTSTTTLSSTSSPAYYYHSSQPIYAHSSAAFDEMPEFKNHQKPKKRGHKPKQLTLEPTNGERRCLHCGVNSTPQWRTGPMGPKTLCNACGVRYKSGRLLPEYRPACSPTFLSHVHSNSHRKVLEMRRKKEEQKKPVYF